MGLICIVLCRIFSLSWCMLSMLHFNSCDLICKFYSALFFVHFDITPKWFFLGLWKKKYIKNFSVLIFPLHFFVWFLFAGENSSKQYNAIEIILSACVYSKWRYPPWPQSSEAEVNSSRHTFLKRWLICVIYKVFLIYDER